MCKIFNYTTFCLIYILTYVFIFSAEKENFYHTIKNDGEGYYAYLPAIYLLRDNTFQKNIETKGLYVEYKDDYLLLNDDGKVTNKYFAGVSMIATPAFIATTWLCKIFGYSADGYHIAYFVSMFLFSIFLFVIGFFLYTTTISRYYQFSSTNKWSFLLFLIATPCLFFSIYFVMYANTYLFFCYAVALYLIIKMIQESKKQNYILSFFFIVGLIAIVRPTSLIFLLIIPFFFDDFQTFKSFLLNHIFRKKKVLIYGFLLFLIPISYQLILWKWQTGDFFVWSYSGEGFNWFNPQLVEVFFSYRIGILFHSPILLFCLIYGLIKLKKHPFQYSFYLLYFFATCYISAAWWCYDFETKHGLRNFNEHYIFMFLPFFDFIKNGKKNFSIYFLIFICTALPFIRFNQFVFGYSVYQRFTKDYYWPSLLFWKKENKQRWHNYQAIKPFGKVVYSEKIIDNQSVKVTPNEEFYLIKTIPMNLKNGERIYLKVSFDRKFKGANNKELWFFIEHYNSTNKEKRVSWSCPAYADKLKEEEHVKISDYWHNNLQNKNEFRVYFWNLNHVKGELNNVNIELEKYATH